MAKLLAFTHAVWPVHDTQFRTEPTAVTTSSMAGTSAGTSLRQVMPQFDCLTGLRIGKPVDRLVTDRHAMLSELQLQAAGDLFERPAVANTLDDCLGRRINLRRL